MGGGFRDVDDVVAEVEAKTTPQRAMSKMERAEQVARKTTEDLRNICKGLNTRVEQLGIEIQRANQYQGVERALRLFGQLGWDWAEDQANTMRHQRLQEFNTQEAVAEIGVIVLATISQLGESEKEYEIDQQKYEAQLTDTLRKQEETTPLYTEAVAKREKLEGKVTSVKKLLDDCTIAQRPKLEREHEETLRDLHQTRLDESTYLAVVKNAQEAIPDLQKSRDAAASAIQSIHGMRQGLLEKYANFRIILERASTAMRARANVALYEDTDPAMNAALTSILENNVATSAAAREVWLQRLKEAVMDPAKAKAIMQEMITDAEERAAHLKEIEEAISIGPRKVPLFLEDMRQGKISIPSVVVEPEKVLVPAAVREHTLEMERARTGTK